MRNLLIYVVHWTCMVHLDLMGDKREHNRNPRMVKPKPTKLERSWKSNVKRQHQFRVRKRDLKEIANVHVIAHESLEDVVTN